MNFLEGKKTYIVGALMVIFSLCYAFGWLEGETFLKLLGILLGAGAITTRMAIAKISRE
jgi:hypothetical protein